jgi:hypothetical protein
MSAQGPAAEKILRRLKGLSKQLNEGEVPLFTLPAIWDGGQSEHSTPCEIVLTNQRVMGFYYASFPRERLFLDALALPGIQVVSLRQKSFEPLFRELLLSDGRRKVYIRAPRAKTESLYTAIRSALEEYAPESQVKLSNGGSASATTTTRSNPTFGRQEIRATFEHSPLAIMLLFLGGLLLEIIGALLWAGTHSAQTGLPLCIAGIVAVITAFLILRQRR